MLFCRRLVLLTSLLMTSGYLCAQLPARLYGTITTSGLPTPNATVSIYRVSIDKKSYSANIVTKTAADGSYSLTVSSGTYIVLVAINGSNVYQGAVDVESGATVEKSIALGVTVPSTPTPAVTLLPILRNRELYDRHYTELSDANLPGVFIYAPSMHTPTLSNPNELEIITYEKGNTNLDVIHAEDKTGRLAIGQIIASGTATQRGMYALPNGNIIFNFNGKTYTLIVTALRHHIGSESIVFDVYKNQ